MDQSWMEVGLCRVKYSLEFVDEFFFAESGMKGNHAKKICQSCSVRIQCRDFALVQPPAQLYGIWGGLNQVDRQYYHREFPELIETLRNRLQVQAEDFEYGVPEVDPLSLILAELGLPPLLLSEVLHLVV